MHLIQAALPARPDHLEAIPLRVDRHKLARRRWRGVAADGTDFGFDVTEALKPGDCIYASDTKCYVIEQTPEDCLLIALDDAKGAAWIGWMVGNLHFKAAFTEAGMLVQDDLAVRQMLEREKINYQGVQKVFQPCKQGGHSHHHSHMHDFGLPKVDIEL
jgi:urease accessory protein